MGGITSSTSLGRAHIGSGYGQCGAGLAIGLS